MNKNAAYQWEAYRRAPLRAYVLKHTEPYWRVGPIVWIPFGTVAKSSSMHIPSATFKQLEECCKINADHSVVGRDCYLKAATQAMLIPQGSGIVLSLNGYNKCLYADICLSQSSRCPQVLFVRSLERSDIIEMLIAGDTSLNCGQGSGKCRVSLELVA